MSNNRKTKSIITQELFKLGVNGQLRLAKFLPGAFHNSRKVLEAADWFCAVQLKVMGQGTVFLILPVAPSYKTDTAQNFKCQSVHSPKNCSIDI